MTQAHRARSHRSAGIAKRVSEPVYPLDILGDVDLQRLSISAKGAWLWSLLTMWHDGSYELSGSLEDFAGDWRCTPSDVESIIGEFYRRNTCIVTQDTTVVTLTCRRLLRRHKDNENNAKRQKKHRDKQLSNDSVTPEYKPPSSPSSPSSSPVGNTEPIRMGSTPEPDAVSAAEACCPVVIIPLVGKDETFAVMQADVDAWQADFPALDVMQEVRSMRAWCDANPKNRKTPSGVKKFIVGWLDRAQNKARRDPVRGTAPDPDAAAIDDYARQYRKMKSDGRSSGDFSDFYSKINDALGKAGVDKVKDAVRSMGAAERGAIEERRLQAERKREQDAMLKAGENVLIQTEEDKK